jgi:lantibiotic biosynthesis protein
MTPDRSKPKEAPPVSAVCSGTIYQGTAGIGLFLAELFAANPIAEFRKTAIGALRHALHDAAKLPSNSFGFHSGRVGAAYAGYRLATLLRDESLFDVSLAVLKPLEGQANNDAGLDVISGSAGAIPALLTLAKAQRQESLSTLAEQLGDHLIQTAWREPFGWSWGSSQPSSVRNLCGLAHGASGIGHALLELFNSSGQGKYLYGAEQAFNYERQFSCPEVSNWPDLRHDELGDLFYRGRTNELPDMVAQNLLPPYNMKYMSAWCHGSPGIGLARLRAYELLHREIYLSEVRQAIRSTTASLKSSRQNYSLCHGLGGNCELLISASRMLNEPELIEPAVECAVAGWEEYEKKEERWPCGTLGSVTDPSLMLGEAGIGYYYLRLFSLDTPAILLHAPALMDGKPAVEWSSYHETRSYYVKSYFEKSLSTEEMLGIDSPVLGVTDDTPRYDVFDCYNSIRLAIEQSSEPERSYLQDASELDRQRFEAAIAINDFTQEFLTSLRKEPWSSLDLSNNIFVLSSSVRIVNTKWDWDSWSAARIVSKELSPPPNRKCSLIFRVDNSTRTHQLDRFPSEVLLSVEHGATFDQVMQRISGLFDLHTPEDVDGLKNRVTLQLERAYEAHIIDVDSPMSEQIVVSTLKDLLLPNELPYSSIEQAQMEFQRLIEIVRSELPRDDALYRSFQCDGIMIQMLRLSQMLHFSVIAQAHAECYFRTSDTEMRTHIMDEFIAMFERVFRMRRDYYFIRQ